MNRDAGFSMIELMVACIILAAVLISVASMVTRIGVTNMEAKDINVASNAVHQEIEILRSTPYADLINGYDGPLFNELEIEGLDRLPGVQGNLKITDEEAGLKKVVVTLIWQRRGSEKPRSFQMETYITSVMSGM